MVKKLSYKFNSLLPVVILIILPFLIFYKSLTGNIIVSGDFTGSDLLDLHLPFKYSLHNSIINKELPIWEKGLSLGFPVLAEGQTGIFYPVNLILGLIEPYLALNLSIIITFIIAGIGTYLYCQSIKLTKFSSFFSAIVFSQSAFFITRIKHLNMIAVAGWFPLAFWSIKKLFDTGKIVYALVLGIIIGLQFLIGHPQMAFFCVFIYLIYFVFEIIINITRPGLNDPQNRGFVNASSANTQRVNVGKKLNIMSALNLLIVSIIIGLAVSAIQILPTIELIGLTQRIDLTFYNAVSYPFTLKSLITFISPYYFGNPATGTYALNIYDQGIFWENCSYLGLLPFVLFIAGVIYLIKKHKLFFSFSVFQSKFNSYLIFYFLLGLISLAFMLGGATPLYKIVWENIPGFSLFRFPNRFNLFLIFSMSLISGFSANLLLSKLLSFRGKGVSTPDSEEVNISWPLGRRPTAALILGFVIIDLAVFANSYISYYKSSDFLKTPSIVDKLKKDPDLYRIYSLTQYGQSPYQTIGWKNDTEPVLTLNSAVAPNKNVLYGLDSFTDRGWFEGGLGISRRNEVENFLLYENKDEVAFGKILGLFNVKYLINFGDPPAIEMYSEEEYDLGKYYTQKLKLIRNDLVVPRVYFVPEAKVVKSGKEAFDNIISINHLGPKTVILEDEPKDVPPDFNGSLEDFKKENPVKFKSYKNNEVIIEASIKQHGFLVFADMYYPGWKVTVGEQPGKILRANYLVRAVELYPGKHTIRFYYDPLSFKVGGGITFGTISILIIYVILKALKNLKHT